MKWNLGWKTLTGALVCAIGFLSQPNILAVLPAKVAGIITALGGLLGAFGLRSAIAKVTPSPAPQTTGSR